MPPRSAGSSISCVTIGRHLQPIRLLLLFLALGAADCTGMRVSPRNAGVETPIGEALPLEAQNLQYLYRVRYSGPAGSGSLKLVLRLGTDRDFQLQAADSLGRSQWVLDFHAGRIQIIDHRRQTFCETEADLRVSEVTLESFSVETLPRLLLGLVPAIPDSALRDSGLVELTDRTGRRWSVRTQDGEITAWTLWSRGEPTLWWTRQPKGGILSHREGSQFRWRQVVMEPLDSEFERSIPPPAYQETSCDDSNLPQFRQDQPSSAAGGPPP